MEPLDFEPGLTRVWKFNTWTNFIFPLHFTVFLMEVDGLNHWYGIVSYGLDWCFDGNDMRWMVGYMNEGNLYMESWMQFLVSQRLLEAWNSKTASFISRPAKLWLREWNISIYIFTH